MIQNNSLISVMAKDSAIERLLEIMRQLRDPESGCPWDIEQTFETIAPYTIEEAYEVTDAIERNDMDDLCSELGDLLLQTVYHTQIAQELGHFNFNDAVDSICNKMIARHPHVFGDESNQKSATQQTIDWEFQKAKERSRKSDEAKTLDGIARTLPPMVRAIKLQKRAAKVGFDWPSYEPVYGKIYEELTELKDAQTHEFQTEEMGDLLFSVINLARHMEIDPEQALKQANKKFTNRFEALEEKVTKSGKTVQSQNIQELEHIWQLVKS